MNKISQDDIREITICEHVGISRAEDSVFAHTTKRREGIDAFDEYGNPFEIKGSCKSDGFSSNRDLLPHKVEKWMNMYWVFGYGHNTRNNFHIKKLHILHPSHMDFFLSSQMKRLQFRVNFNKRLMDWISQGPFSPSEIKVTKQRLHDGSRLNDPKISASKIANYGTPLDVNNSEIAQEQLKAFVEKYPLDVEFSPKINIEADIFETLD